MRFDIEEFVRLELFKCREVACAVLAINVRVVIRGTDGVPAVPPMNSLSLFAFVNSLDVAAPVGIATGQINENSIEPVTPLKRDEGVAESLG